MGLCTQVTPRDGEYRSEEPAGAPGALTSPASQHLCHTDPGGGPWGSSVHTLNTASVALDAGLGMTSTVSVSIALLWWPLKQRAAVLRILTPDLGAWLEGG